MATNVSKYRQIADDLRTGILDGSYPPHTRLPSRRDLVAVYGVSSATVAHAVDVLAQEGLVMTGQGFAPMVAQRSATTVQDFTHALMASMVQWRHKYGLNQNQVAVRAGMAPSQICELELGKILNPGLHTYVRYAEAIGARITFDLEPLDAPQHHDDPDARVL